MDDRDGAKPRSRGGLVVGAWGRVRCRNREDERECNAGGDRLSPMEGVQTPLGGENGRRLMVGRSEGRKSAEAAPRTGRTSVRSLAFICSPQRTFFRMFCSFSENHSLIPET